MQICCEGPACNGGISANEREAALLPARPSSNAEMRDEAERFARKTVTARLAVTEHARVGARSRGTVTFALYGCVACGHERIYGNSAY